MRAETLPGTCRTYRGVVAEEGFEFAGTRYNPETVAARTSGGLLRGAVSKGSLALAGLTALGMNLWTYGTDPTQGKTFWDRTVKNREFWVSTGVDFVVSVAVGVVAAAVVAAAVSVAPLLFAGAAVSLTAAVVATTVVSVGLGMGVEAFRLPGVGKSFPDWAKDSINKLFSQRD